MTLMIGDIHSQAGIAEKFFLKKYKGEMKVSVGDLVDDSSIPDKDVVETMRIAVSTDPRSTILLTGNHELNYFGAYAEKWKKAGDIKDRKGVPRCVGFRKSIFNDIYSIIEKNQSRFKLAYYDKDTKTLITHAGVSRAWFGMLGESGFVKRWDYDSLISYLENTNPFSIPETSPIFYEGKSIAGPISCRLECFEPILDLNQVFGHTPTKRIRRIDCLYPENYMIDCLKSKTQILEAKKRNGETEFKILELYGK